MDAPSQTPGVNLRYVVPICLAAALGGLLFGFDTGVISGAIEPLTVRFGLSPFMKGWVSGCALVGCGVGVLAVGAMADRFGRKLPLLLSAAMFFVSALGTSIPDSLQVFIAFRIIGGLGIGIASIATPMYIAEISPAHLRGRLVAVNQIAIVAGLAGTAFVNYFIAHRGDQAWLASTGWRWMFASGIAPSVVFGLLVIGIPESPRWLAEAGRDGEAKDILGRVIGTQFAGAALADIQGSLAQDRQAGVTLFSRKVSRPLVIGIALAILQQVTGINVFMYFGATIFRNLSASTGVDAGLLQQVIINGSSVVFTLIAIASVDQWGRRPLMLLGSAGMALALAAMGIMAQQTVNPAGSAGWMLAFILVYIAAFGLSVGPVTWVILVEILPTAVRGKALGLTAFFLWGADYVVTQTFTLLDAPDSWFVRQFHHAFPFYLYGAFCLVLIGVVGVFVPETKGRTLEQIESEWERKTDEPVSAEIL